MDHALVFMLKGIKKPWKQTICYHFSKGPTKSEEIQRLLKILVEKLNDVNGT